MLQRITIGRTSTVFEGIFITFFICLCSCGSNIKTIKSPETAIRVSSVDIQELPSIRDPFFDDASRDFSSALRSTLGYAGFGTGNDLKIVYKIIAAEPAGSFNYPFGVQSRYAKDYTFYDGGGKESGVRVHKPSRVVVIEAQLYGYAGQFVGYRVHYSPPYFEVEATFLDSLGKELAKIDVHKKESFYGGDSRMFNRQLINDIAKEVVKYAEEKVILK